MGNPEYSPASDLAAPLKSNTRHALWQESDNTTQKDITMFRFAQRFGRDSQAKHTRARRPRSFKASLEAVEDRTLMSSITSVTWNSGGVNHSDVFALGFNNTVSMSKDGGSFVSESGYLTAISAGLDSAGNPEVYGIGGNNAVWVDDNGAGWVSRSGYVKAISASVNNTVFAIGGDNAVYVNRGGTGWTDLGGDFTAISAGLDSYGNPEIYAIGTNNAAYSNDNGAGWVYRSGYVKAISGSVNNTVFAIGGDNAVYMNRGGRSGPTWVATRGRSAPAATCLATRRSTGLAVMPPRTSATTDRHSAGSAATLLISAGRGWARSTPGAGTWNKSSSANTRCPSTT